MLDHVSITVSDLDAAERFYDAVMSAIGVSKVRRSETRLGYGERCDSEHPDRSYLSVKLGDKPEPNYSRHWCFKAPDRAAVVAFWRAGIGNGGADDGPPGIRAVTTLTITQPSWSTRAVTGLKPYAISEKTPEG
jgi:catechol 2,3-dioxygenase-like lactoylglutathione lyase family enzyme